jgi:hypothetical protein
VVVAQVDPAVAGVQVPGGGAAEGRLGDERAARRGVWVSSAACDVVPESSLPSLLSDGST